MAHIRLSPIASVLYPEVNTYVELPSANEASGKTYIVKTTTGIWPLRRSAGFYISNGTTWTYLGDIDPAQIKALYESNPNTNAYTNVEKTLLSSLNDRVSTLEGGGGAAGYFSKDYLVQTTSDSLTDLGEEQLTDGLYLVEVKALGAESGSQGKQIALRKEFKVVVKNALAILNNRDLQSCYTSRDSTSMDIRVSTSTNRLKFSVKGQPTSQVKWLANVKWISMEG